MKLTAAQIVERFMTVGHIVEHVDDLAVFVWDEFQECPRPNVLADAMRLIKALRQREWIKRGSEWTPEQIRKLAAR